MSASVPVAWTLSAGPTPLWIERVPSVAHAGALRAIVHALKYDGRRSVAGATGASMRWLAPICCRDCDAAVPVPLHAARRRARGFNQAEDLARHIGLPVVPALKRIRHTETQTALSASERHHATSPAHSGTTRRAPRCTDARATGR